MISGRSSQMVKMGAAIYNPSTHKAAPQWTVPNGSSGSYYVLAPEDLATQYDITPLYGAGINGSGQTIGIINDSNIDLGLVAAYRKLYGLDADSSSPNLPQVIIDGEDPGIIGDSEEAYLDVKCPGRLRRRQR